MSKNNNNNNVYYLYRTRVLNIFFYNEIKSLSTQIQAIAHVFYAHARDYNIIIIIVYPTADSVSFVSASPASRRYTYMSIRRSTR